MTPQAKMLHASSKDRVWTTRTHVKAGHGWRVCNSTTATGRWQVNAWGAQQEYKKVTLKLPCDLHSCTVVCTLSLLHTQLKKWLQWQTNAYGVCVCARVCRSVHMSVPTEATAQCWDVFQACYWTRSSSFQLDWLPMKCRYPPASSHPTKCSYRCSGSGLTFYMGAENWNLGSHVPVASATHWTNFPAPTSGKLCYFII